MAAGGDEPAVGIVVCYERFNVLVYASLLNRKRKA